jgi:hypothetical protein
VRFEVFIAVAKGHDTVESDRSVVMFSSTVLLPHRHQADTCLLDDCSAVSSNPENGGSILLRQFSKSLQHITSHPEDITTDTTTSTWL